MNIARKDSTERRAKEGLDREREEREALERRYLSSE
jgi:hypothetical protein